jgi:hypothetical protein
MAKIKKFADTTVIWKEKEKEKKGENGPKKIGACK